MIWLFERLQRHSSAINAEIALPGAPFELAPVFDENYLPKLDFGDLGEGTDVDKYIEKLEDQARVQRGTYARTNEEFWDKLRIRIIGDEKLPLDDSRPLDQLRIAFARCKEIVSQDEGERGNKAIEVLMVNTGAKVKAEAAREVSIGQAYAIIYKTEDKRQLLVLLGRKYKDVAKLSTEDVVVELGKVATNTPQELITVDDDKQKNMRYNVRKGVATGLLVKQGDRYFLTSDITKPLADDENGMIEWLSDPENSDERRKLEAALQKV